MTLNVSYSCLGKTNYFSLAINVLSTIYLGIQMPNSKFSKWMSCECLDRPRKANEPPFFFFEVRIGMLICSLLFNFSRLIYEAVIHDISVILVAARLIFTTLQLVDHWWFCKHWESFFIEKTMRAYMWFRLFLTVFMFSMIFCVLVTFAPYRRKSLLIYDACQWIAGIQAMIWYYWGKHWKFTWGDMSDERRIRAYVGAMFTTTFIYVILAVYQVFTDELGFKNVIASITAAIAYGLMGFAFHYLNILTNRSTQACLRILEESKVHTSAISGRNPSLLGGGNALSERGNLGGIHQPSSRSSFSPVPSNRRRSSLMKNVRQLLRNQGESSRQKPTTTEIGNTGNKSEKIVEENHFASLEDQEEQDYIEKRSNRDPTPLLMSSHVHSSNNNMTVNLPNDSGGGDIESKAASPSEVDTVQVQPLNPIQPTSSSMSHIDVYSTSSNKNRSNDSGDVENNISRSNKDGNDDKMENMRIKPSSNSITIPSSSSHTVVPLGPSLNTDLDLTPLNNNHDHSNRIGSLRPPLSDSMNDHVPLAKHNSLEMNLINYETAHLLSDKIVVVFVQVVQWYIFMMIIERCIESYYEPEGYDDTSGTIPVLLWCPTLSVFSGSTFASVQRIIDALF